MYNTCRTPQHLFKGKQEWKKAKKKRKMASSEELINMERSQETKKSQCHNYGTCQSTSRATSAPEAVVEVHL